MRGARRERLLAAARAAVQAGSEDLTELSDALDERGRPVARLARVIEYEVPDRDGNGSGELIVLLTTILHPEGEHGTTVVSRSCEVEDLEGSVDDAAGFGDDMSAGEMVGADREVTC